MRIQSKLYGDIDLAEAQNIEISEGILGFPDYTRYVLHPDPDNSSIFYWVQSLEDPQLAFPVLPAASVLKDYTPSCLDSDLAKIDAQSISDVGIFLIVTLREQINEISANLRGPLLVNLDTQRAIQAISNDDSHQVRYKLFQE